MTVSSLLNHPSLTAPRIVSRLISLMIDMSAPIMFEVFFILVDDCIEVTDYAIARRIFDLPTKLVESDERTYTEKEVVRY